MEAEVSFVGKTMGACALACSAALMAAGCTPTLTAEDEAAVGVVTAEVKLAPPDARCVEILVANASTELLARRFEITPEASSVFTLERLPAGVLYFSARVFGASCAQGPGEPAQYRGGPVAATVLADEVVTVTIPMRRVGEGTRTAVGLDFQPNEGAVTTFDLPAPARVPADITAGPDGNMWYVAFSAANSLVGRVGLNGHIVEFPTPTRASQPAEIAAGPDGNMWFVEFTASKIGRITTQGIITEFTLPGTNRQPTALTAGPDGKIWFTMFGVPSRIGTITTQGAIAELPLPAGTPNDLGLFAITVGSDGAMWATAQSGARLVRYTVAGAYSEAALPPGTVPSQLTTGGDTNLWVADDLGNRILRVNPTSRAVTGVFPVPTPNSRPQAMTTGPDGFAWFSEFNSGKVGRISPAGTITEFLISPQAGPLGVGPGPDGNTWFAAGLVNRVGYVVPAP